ncbi:6-hydroxymethylpterin diphosphokinase MptE-like protein [Amphiplicatus metriothermophilus]|uniref:Methyltransferase domain-containing protein n=1 Tax=Amphiplicatus metriothermophilus TaxID=1519374 RepID=A0A239Q0E7_9PROT|nr:6-hydroxymethylpterin diphosphokinase MptE-like protein [Amphiplicatus metriothermophilus]MBB5520092.1 glycosyltransferase involved in cell wall biosynthesis [Amphiplicatus metriothermophilus]SNT75900.1 Methyltransferase domain-containing protein [Amphiplicatus metriothermophilus]
MKRKILIYTDSRGQHIPRAAEPFEIFTMRLANHPRVEATVLLCPMKWTTTIDFLDFLEEHRPENFDHVVLQTGIVEWSPRPQPSAINDLYNNKNPVNQGNQMLNTREYARKVVNNKKLSFDKIFTEEAMLAHLHSNFDVEYEGHPTINMYSLDMAEKNLLPRLLKIENLLFVNSNRFVPGWEGDFTRGRPKNIGMTAGYSALFRDVLGPNKTIDLLGWTEAEIQRYTCDNIHYTKAGSDYIYEELAKRLRLEERSFRGARMSNPQDNGADKPFAPNGRPLLAPKVLSAENRRRALEAAGLEAGEKLATLIVGCRFPDDDSSRVNNLRFLLAWIDRFYSDLFDVLLVEQDAESKIDLLGSVQPYVRHEFIYNPRSYNRGWGYNVAVKHFTKNDVVALLDTDVLLGANFVDEIIACHTKYKAISPYANVYFMNVEETDEVVGKFSLDGLRRQNGVKKPTTITGGVVIMRRDAYLRLLGFEQYTSYGGEDRALDVALLESCGSDEVRVAEFVYAHLFHPSTEPDKTELDKVLAHLRDNYGCTVNMSLSAADDIHENCAHKSLALIERNIEKRASSFGDPQLYRSGRELTVNGLYVDEVTTSERTAPVFPPGFTTLEGYPAKELYDAPDPDSEEIAALYNAFRGERCFIIGNGPSLNKHDLSLLKNEYVFAVNSFFYKTDETGFRPTFYVVEDTSVMKENIERIRAYNAEYKFFPTIYRKLHPKTRNTLFFRMNRGFYEKSSPNYCVPRFSRDASRVLYCGQSVTYINLQLAYFLGFTEVYLIGMDFDYVIPREHKRNGDVILSTTDDPNHFHKDYFGKGKTWKDPKLDRVAMNYREAKLAYESVGRRIYNATIGGKLEIFERVDYERTLSKRTLSKQLAQTPSEFSIRNRAAIPKPASKELLISVIVPAYNVDSYIEECLDSLVAQDDDNFEVVIVDDGSTDGTSKIIDEYCARRPNFMSVRQDNSGLGAARNAGVKVSRGEFILFVDSDDYVSSNAISALRAEQKRGDFDVVTGRFVRVSEDGVAHAVRTDQLPQHEIPQECPPLSPSEKVLGAFAPSVAWARLYRKSLIQENGLVFPPRAPHEDLYFTFKALAFSKRVSQISDEIYFYRQRDGSISKRVSEAHIETIFAQWRDADAFMAARKARPIARALIARRTLYMIEGVRKRLVDAPENIKERFQEELNLRRIGLQALLSDFRQSKIAKSATPKIAEQLIDSLQERRRLFRPFILENVLYPHYDIDLGSYAEREIVEISEEERRALSQFHNAYKGKRCFIIGNGPSLNKHDLSLLKNEYTFAVNSFFYKTREIGFRPTFFVVEDNLVMRENIDDIKTYKVPFKFFPANYRDLHPPGRNVFFFPANWGFYLQSSPNYCAPRFSTDATKELFCGQTVTYINMQLAFFMGFTEVYLIGMDFNYVIPTEHGREGNWIYSKTDDPNHFHKDYFGKGKTWKDPKLDRVANSYRQAKIAYESAGRKIYNATIGGQLEVFERVDYHSLFKNSRGERLTKAAASVQSLVVASPSPGGRPFYAPFGDWLMARAPRLFGALRFARRALAGMWRRRLWTLPALILLAALFLAGFLPDLAPHRAVIWTVGGFAAVLFAVFYLALRVYQFVSTLSAEAAALRAEARALRRRLDDDRRESARRAEETAACLDRALGEFRNHVAEAKAANDAQVAAAESLEARLVEAERAGATAIERVRSELSDAAKKAEAGEKALRIELDKVAKAAESANQALRSEIAAATQIQRELEAEKRFSNYSNVASVRAHERRLSDADVAYIQNNWLRLLGITLSNRQIHYLAHQICLAEERCEGRLATTIQAAVLRTLALLSIQRKKIDLLEIGALFGIGAGMLYKAGERAQRTMHLTLVDPLDGYYDRGIADAATGVPVTRNTLVGNMAALGVPKSRYRIIQHLSTDEEALKLASDKQYDYVLIDGDHSLEGVASDFDLYGPLVKPGGVLIFDDYNTKDWPAIKPFVDEKVRPLGEWLWIGGEWRTAILRRRRRRGEKG